MFRHSRIVCLKNKEHLILGNRIIKYMYLTQKVQFTTYKRTYNIFFLNKKTKTVQINVISCQLMYRRK